MVYAFNPATPTVWYVRDGAAWFVVPACPRGWDSRRVLPREPYGLVECPRPRTAHVVGMP